jgi:hypothetical protein
MFETLLGSETPLVSKSNISDLIGSMSDSLEVYRDLFPFLLKFASYPEYKTGVYTLMAEMLDSGIMRPKHYKNYKKDLVREAKDGLKRVMAEAHDDNEYSYSRYSYHSDLLEAYNTLLIPFKNNKDVQEYFDRTRRLPSEPDLLNTSLQMVEAGMRVEDSIWAHFGNDEKYLIKMYSRLKDMGKTDLIPDSCLRQENVARALLYRYSNIDEEDSVQFLRRVKAQNRKRKGYIYVFKKKDSYNDAEWNYDYVGVLPEDSTEIPKWVTIRDTGNDYLDEEDLDEKMEDAVENALYAHRKRVKKKTRRRSYYGY